MEEIARVAEEVKVAREEQETPIPPSTQAEPDLNELARKLFHAKRAEKNAKDVRIAAEIEVAALVRIDCDKSSRTVDAGDGLKVTVKHGFNYKADVNAIRDMDLPEGVSPLTYVPAGYVFDPRAYENIRENHPDIAGRLTDFVTVAPAKIAVTLKLA